MLPNTHEISFCITGDVAAASFPRWINRHAKKLGVQNLQITAGDNSLTVQGVGAREMLEALAIACTLGPSEVQVENVTGLPELSEFGALNL